MNIHFENIIPAPLEDQTSNSQIWGKTITFTKGTNYGILAPSGKGKSTFAHILYGLRNDFSGNLIWEDKNVAELDWNEKQTLRLTHQAIVFQDLRLFQALTAWENILLHREDLPQGKIEVNETTLKTWIDRLGITKVINQPVALLSFGQRQRFAIIRALSRPYSWLILDEPFSHLDEENEKKAAELIIEQVQSYNSNLIITALNVINPIIQIDEYVQL